MKIKLITDSACSLPKDAVEKYNIEVLPLGIVFGNTEYKDGVTITDDEFFQMQETGDVVPKTSQINQFEFQEVFEKYLGEYDHLVVMTLSEKLSGTYQSAVSAKRELGVSNIHILDTKSVSVGSGLSVYATAMLIDSGAEIDEVVEKANEYIDKVDVYATFESLKYLKAGGRMSSLSAMVGSMLKVKIVLSTKGGLVVASEKVISSKKAFRRIKELVRDNFDPSMPVLFAEGACKDMALEIASEYQSEFGLENWKLAGVGCTVGVHTGPNAFGVAYFKK